MASNTYVTKLVTLFCLIYFVGFSQTYSESWVALIPKNEKRITEIIFYIQEVLSSEGFKYIDGISYKEFLNALNSLNGDVWWLNGKIPIIKMVRDGLYADINYSFNSNEIILIWKLTGGITCSSKFPTNHHHNDIEKINISINKKFNKNIFFKIR